MKNDVNKIFASNIKRAEDQVRLDEPVLQMKTEGVQTKPETDTQEAKPESFGDNVQSLFDDLQANVNELANFNRMKLASSPWDEHLKFMDQKASAINDGMSALRERLGKLAIIG